MEYWCLGKGISMAKPYIHAQSSSRKFGGIPEDYLPIHDFLDSSKAAIPSSIHRVLLHNSWAIGPDGILEKVFGKNITNSEGKLVSVRDIGEQHILEDFSGKFIPTVQDYLSEIKIKKWMLNGHGEPPDSIRVNLQTKTTIIKD